MPKAIADSDEYLEMMIQFIGFGPEQISIDLKPSISRKHCTDLLEGKTGIPPQCDKLQLLYNLESKEPS